MSWPEKQIIRMKSARKSWQRKKRKKKKDCASLRKKIIPPEKMKISFPRMMNSVSIHHFCFNNNMLTREVPLLPDPDKPEPKRC